MNTVDIACVIPTHNRSDLLVEALTAIEAQTALPAEVIVVSDVDDADALAVVEASAARGLPVRFVRGEAGIGGASASRNRGAAESTAGAIAFLDDDDWWHPTYLERVAAVLEDATVDAVVTWIEIVTESGDRREGPAIAAGLEAAGVVAMNRGSTGSNMVIRRAAFERIDGFDTALRFKNDTDFFYRLLASGARYAVIEDRLMFQRMHGTGQLTGLTEARAKGQEAYLAKHASVLAPADRREIKMWVHYTRAHAAKNPVVRLGHWVAAASLIPPRKVVRALGFAKMRRVTTVRGFDEKR